MKTYYAVTTTVDDKGRVNSAVTDERKADAMPKSSFQATKTKDVYVDWFDSRKAALQHVEDSKNA